MSKSMKVLFAIAAISAAISFAIAILEKNIDAALGWFCVVIWIINYVVLCKRSYWFRKRYTELLTEIITKLIIFKVPKRNENEE